MVGSAILRRLQARGYANIVKHNHADLDLVDQMAVRAFFERERPEYVFLAAAMVGGIHANNTRPAEFVHQNLAIQTNVIHEAWRVDVRRLLFLGSSCIYPRDCPQPMREDHLLTGPLELTNRPYAVAKIAGIEMCWDYNRQYGTRYLAAMPTNLYGPGDNYNLETSHVIPALIRKMHEAKVRGTSVSVWGTGTPRREFLYSDDAADACVFLMELSEVQCGALVSDRHSPPLVNIGCGQDATIRELTELAKEVVGFKGDVRFDPAKPDGTPRKLLDISRLNGLGWTARTDLRTGLQATYHAYLQTI